MPVFDCQDVIEVNVLFLLYESVGVHESLQIDHQYIRQLFKGVDLLGSYRSAVYLVALDFVLLEVIVQAIFDGAFVVGNV